MVEGRRAEVRVEPGLIAAVSPGNRDRFAIESSYESPGTGIERSTRHRDDGKE
jgi:hypothetical protein